MIGYEELSKVFDMDNPLTLEYFEICDKDTIYDGRTHKHHILPKSIFPQYAKQKWNIVKLTHKEHREVHEKLPYICLVEENRVSMVQGLAFLTNYIKPKEIRPAIDRFEDKVMMEPMSGCWLWVGALDNSFGYGKFRYNSISVAAHRAGWMIYRGTIPEGLFVCHTCDNSACVNPNHMFLGTSDDNNKDRHRKGRSVIPVGEQNGHSKLTESDVLRARELYKFGLNGVDTARFLAFDFRTMYDAIHYKTWKHVK